MSTFVAHWPGLEAAKNEMQLLAQWSPWALHQHGSSLGHWWVFRNCKLTTHFFSTHVPLLWQPMTRDTLEYKTYIGNTCIMIEILSLNSAEQKHKYTKLFYVCSVLSLCTTWRVGQLHGCAISSKFTVTLKGSSGKQKYLQHTYSGCSLTVLLLYWLSLSPSDEGMAFPKVSLKFSVSLNCVLLDSPLAKWVTIHFVFFFVTYSSSICRKGLG